MCRVIHSSRIGATHLLFVALLASPATAAIEGYATLQIEDFVLTKTVGGTTTPLAVSDFTAFSASFFSRSTAQLLPSAPTTFTDSDLDVIQAAQGSGFPAENTFTNTPSGSTFARGDTNGSGVIIAGLPQPYGASVQTVAETQLTGTGALSGNSAGLVESTAGFSFTLANPLTINIDFDGFVSLLADLDQPPGITATASSRFSINVEENSGAFEFSWTPNGQAGGITGGTELIDSFDLTRNISQNFDGTNAFTSGGFLPFSATVDLPAGDYNFQITHSTESRVSTNAIPEPTSVFIWAAILGGCSAAGLRRERKPSC